MATGCSFGELHYGYRLGKSTIAYIVRQVCEALWAKLKDKYMPEMSTDKWKEVEKGFQKNAQFPNCIGAIDGKHIRLVQPAHTGSLYFNFKNFFSSLLLAVCDADYCLTYVDIGSYGKSSDSAVFQQSILYKKLSDNSLKLPDKKPISEADPTPLPHVLVGDEAFGIMANVMRPYGGKNLSHVKKVFNYRLSRARRYIECTFGILCNKWRILHRALDVNIDFAEQIIRACTMLHNYVRINDGYSFEDTLYASPLEDMDNQNVPRGTSSSAASTRDKFATYFVSDEGKLQWQDDQI